MTASAFSEVVEKASIQPVKKSSLTRKYLNILTLGICVNSICQFWVRVNPWAW